MTTSQRVITVLVGQFISQLGGALTGFAFGIMVFKLDSRVSDLSLLYFYQLLPMIVIMLPAGFLVDRFKKKNLALICQFLSIILLSWIFFLYYHQQLTKWDLYIYVALTAIFSTLEGLATTALIGINIADWQKTKFNIFLNLRQVIPRLMAPIFAGYWVMYGNNNFLLTIDLLSSVFSICMMLQLKEDTKPENVTTLLATFQDYHALAIKIGVHLPLLWSLICISISICTISLLGVYFLPITLQLTTPFVSGNLSALGGAGAIVAGLLVTVIPSQKQHINHFIPLSLAMQGLILLVGLLSPHFYSLGLILFLYYLINPWQRGHSYTLWEVNIRKDLYGKAFAIKSFVLQSVSAMVFLVAGPLIDDVLVPLLKSHPLTHQFPMLRSPSESVTAMLLVLTVMGLMQFMLGLYIYYRQKIPLASEVNPW